MLNINEKELIDLLDHIELVNWIHLMSYHMAKVGYSKMEEPTLPSGIKVRITISVEEMPK